MRKVALTIGEAYELLNLPAGSHESDVKRKFRELSLKYHPDRVGPQNKDIATEYFKWLSLAKDIALNHQRPGRPEFDKFKRFLSQDPLTPSKAYQAPPKQQTTYQNQQKPVAGYVRDLSELGRKKLILELAKKFGKRAVRKTNDKDMVFAIRLSDVLGIRITFFQDLAKIDAFVTLGAKNAWKRLSDSWIDRAFKVSEVERKIRSIITYFRSNRLKLNTEALGITSLGEWRDGSKQDHKNDPFVPNQTSQEIRDTIKRIRDIKDWRSDRSLENFMDQLENGSPLQPWQMELLDWLERLWGLFWKFQGPRDKTKRKRISFFIRKARERKLTSKHIEEIERWEKKKPSQPKSESKAQSNQKSTTYRGKPTRKQMVQLRRYRLRIEPKDRQRVETILSKKDPVREAKIQSAKIKDAQKALRRARAALEYFDSYTFDVDVGVWEVSRIFLNRAFELGFEF